MENKNATMETNNKQTVNHNRYGIGEVVKRETTENGVYLTVKFNNAIIKYNIYGIFVHLFCASIPCCV